MGFIARFFLLVLFLSIGELYLLVELSMRISVLLTFVLCALTGIVGGAMVRHQGLRTLSEIGQNLSSGKMPGEAIVSGLILLSIGIMLLTPGFITDTVAFLMLVPSLRNMAAGFLVAWFKKKATFKAMQMGPGAFQAGFGGGFSGGRNHRRRRPDNDQVIIETEARDAD